MSCFAAPTKSVLKSSGFLTCIPAEKPRLFYWLVVPRSQAARLLFQRQCFAAELSCLRPRLCLLLLTWMAAF